MADLSNMTDEQLEREMAKREKAKKEALMRQRRQFEAKREKTVNELVDRSIQLNEILTAFKRRAFTAIKEYELEVEKYGGVGPNSLGGFQIRSDDKNRKVVFRRERVNELDERADIAAQLISEFLTDMVKKKDKDAFEMLMTLLAKDKKGNLNPSRVILLLKQEDRFKDEKWRKAVRLMKEAFDERPIAYGIAFYEKDPKTGVENHIPLSLSSIKI